MKQLYIYVLCGCLGIFLITIISHYNLKIKRETFYAQIDLYELIRKLQEQENNDDVALADLDVNYGEVERPPVEDTEGPLLDDSQEPSQSPSPTTVSNPSPSPNTATSPSPSPSPNTASNPSLNLRIPESIPTTGQLSSAAISAAQSAIGIAAKTFCSTLYP